MVTDYTKCSELIEELKLAEAKYSQIVENNEDELNLNSESTVRFTISVRPGLF